MQCSSVDIMSSMQSLSIHEPTHPCNRDTTDNFDNILKCLRCKKISYIGSRLNTLRLLDIVLVKLHYICLIAMHCICKIYREHPQRSHFWKVACMKGHHRRCFPVNFVEYSSGHLLHRSIQNLVKQLRWTVLWK